MPFTAASPSFRHWHMVLRLRVRGLFIRCAPSYGCRAIVSRSVALPPQRVWLYALCTALRAASPAASHALLPGSPLLAGARVSRFLAPFLFAFLLALLLPYKLFTTVRVGGSLAALYIANAHGSLHMLHNARAPRQHIGFSVCLRARAAALHAARSAGTERAKGIFHHQRTRCCAPSLLSLPLFRRGSAWVRGCVRCASRRAFAFAYDGVRASANALDLRVGVCETLPLAHALSGAYYFTRSVHQHYAALAFSWLYVAAPSSCACTARSGTDWR